MEEPPRNSDTTDATCFAHLIGRARALRVELSQRAVEMRILNEPSLAVLWKRAKEAERAARAAIDDRNLRKRKPPEAGLPVPAIPPRGPLPLQGGAEAPLDFD